MLRTKALATLALAGALVSLPAFAAEEGPRQKSEVSVQGFGSFVKDTTDGGVRQSATNSGGVLASYRFFFNRNHGVEVNYGYALNTQKYDLTSGAVGVNSRSHEVTAAYVFRYPLRRLTPFVSAGVGGLVFDPKNTPGANTQARAAFVYGAGADFNVTKRLFVRAQYRGLVYNTPNFDVGALNVDRVTHRAEPSAGIGFRF